MTPAETARLAQMEADISRLTGEVRALSLFVIALIHELPEVPHDAFGTASEKLDEAPEADPDHDHLVFAPLSAEAHDAAKKHLNRMEKAANDDHSSFTR